MSRLSKKVFREMQKFMEANEFENEEQASEAMWEFIEQYDENLQSHDDMEPETSWDYLEMAFDAPTEKEAVRYAKKALELDAYCTDAEMMIAYIQCGDDFEKFKKKLEKIITKTEKHLREEGCFDDDCVGEFWGMLETRPYMRARYQYFRLLISAGKMKKAKEECEDMLCLNKNDNLGIRYVLMGIYAYFEDELSAMRLYREYNECSVHMLLPLITLYYKKDSYRIAEKYLRLISSEGFNKYFLTFGEFDDFEDDLDDDMPSIDRYRRGTEEDVAYAIENCVFLYMSTPGILEWIEKRVSRGL